MVEAAGGTAAKHGSACLVHALIELGCADVTLLIIIIGCAGHDLRVWRVDGAAALASVRLDRDRARRLRASGDLALGACLVAAGVREGTRVIVVVVEGLSVRAVLLLEGLVGA